MKDYLRGTAMVGVTSTVENTVYRTTMRTDVEMKLPGGN